MNWISVFRSKNGLSKAHMHTCSRTKQAWIHCLFYSILSLCTLNKESKEALTGDYIQREQLHVCTVFLVKIQWFHTLFIPTPPVLLLLLVLLISHYNLIFYYLLLILFTTSYPHTSFYASLFFLMYLPSVHWHSDPQQLPICTLKFQ